MNFGTKVRTIARVVASLNTAVYAVSASVAGLGFDWLTLVWAILTIVVDFAVAFFTTYYNNDYTKIACEHTGAMRLEKQQTKGKVNGEDFVDEIEEDIEESEGE